MTRWQRLDVFGIGPALPRRAGVYAIAFDGIVVYVGSTKNLYTRVAEHRIRYGYARNIHTPWGPIPDAVRVTIKVKPSRRFGDWAMDELRLIRRLQPLYNRMHCKRVKLAEAA